MIPSRRRSLLILVLAVVIISAAISGCSSETASGFQIAKYDAALDEKYDGCLVSAACKSRFLETPT